MVMSSRLISILLCALSVSLISSEARSVGNAEMESLTGGHMLGHEKAKRFYFDANCFGIYDRETLSELDAVCEECYNLYRKPHVASGCRQNCFNSDVFAGCVRDLMLHDRADEFQDMVHIVSGRK